MSNLPLLSIVTFLPLVGAAFIFFIRGEPEVVAQNSRAVALWTSLATFVLSLFVWTGFDSTQAGFQFVEKAAWLSRNSFHLYAFWLGVLVAFMTAFYSWRLLFVVFHGEPRMDHHTFEHAHESPAVMLVPLIVLAVGAVVAGFFGVGMVHNPARFFDGAIATHEGGAAEIEHVPFLIGILPLVAGLSGIALAYVLYIRRPDLPDRIVAAIHPLYVFSYRKWFFDEIYDVLFVRSARALGLGLWRGGDQAVIDRFGPDGIAATTIATARRAVRLQTGYVYHYAFAMLIGVAALVTYYLWALRG